MTAPPAERQAHWSRVYATKAPDSASWYRSHLEVALELLERGGLSPDSRIIDVGGGASTLVDDLLARGLQHITVLDIAAEALAATRARLGPQASDVQWITGDLLETPLPQAAFDLWHDRAVLHFLVDPAVAARYARIATDAVCRGGHAVISGFAPDGPERCSGLPVARRSAADVAQLMGPDWTLVEQRSELHVTPAGNPQSFAYALLRRN
jgi:SAM-dependent methyltransferase